MCVFLRLSARRKALYMILQLIPSSDEECISRLYDKRHFLYSTTSSSATHILTVAFGVCLAMPSAEGGKNMTQSVTNLHKETASFYSSVLV